MTNNISILILAILSSIQISYGQNSLTAFLKDEKTKEPLILANVVLKGTTNGTNADTNGRVILENIPNGKQTLIFSYVGYRTIEKIFEFPIEKAKSIVILLEPDLNLDEITVYSTRTNNRIKEIPTRIEVLGNEEVVEESAITPGNISKLLSETSGVRAQQASAISGNVSFRIHGLPGQYTQLLQDGFRMYSGFSSGLSLIQIPPLNLQQVEIIKGSASTLYGGDAIAGIVNLITKKPTNKNELSVLVNQTHLGGNDLSSYYSAKKDKFGITMLASFNTQKAKDISKNNFTDLPKYNRVVINPKLFYDFNKNNHLTVDLFSVVEDRTGGDINVLNGQQDNTHLFFEENKTHRYNGNFKFENFSENGNVLSFKTSIGNFERNLKTNTNVFKGTQNTIFAELSYFIDYHNHKLVSGVNYYLDDFQQQQTNLLSYNHKTFGIFTQDNWKISDNLILEPGIRYDYNLKYGNFFLPRLAVMYHFTDSFFTRISSGLGYKLPIPFTDDAERTRYQNVSPVNNLKSEKSTGLNFDFNYKTPLFDELFLTLNQAFFVTEIVNPIIADTGLLENQIVFYENANGNIVSKGLNTNIRLSMDELTLYIDYTYLDAIKTYEDNKPLELTPKNRFTTTLAYEDEEDGWKVGLEALYFGHQYLENGNKTPVYWLLGASVQKLTGHFTIALNLENILDIRQTRYENIVSGNLNNPVFNEIYAPLDGIVGNIVLKYDFY